MYKEDLVLNNLQWLICHKTKQNQTKPPKFFAAIKGGNPTISRMILRE